MRTRRTRASKASTPKQSKLCELSDETISDIRSYIPADVLTDHIAFQSVCKKVRAVYYDDEKFWQHACHAAGISKPRPHIAFSFQGCTWRQLAILYANHVAFCHLEMCTERARHGKLSIY
jgi:hypothetical protein